MPGTVEAAQVETRQPVRAKLTKHRGHVPELLRHCLVNHLSACDGHVDVRFKQQFPDLVAGRL